MKMKYQKPELEAVRVETLLASQFMTVSGGSGEGGGDAKSNSYDDWDDED